MANGILVRDDDTTAICVRGVEVVIANYGIICSAVLLASTDITILSDFDKKRLEVTEVWYGDGRGL